MRFLLMRRTLLEPRQAERVAAYRRRRRHAIIKRIIGLSREPLPPRPRL